MICDIFEKGLSDSLCKLKFCTSIINRIEKFKPQQLTFRANWRDALLIPLQYIFFNNGSSDIQFKTIILTRLTILSSSSIFSASLPKKIELSFGNATKNE